MQADRLTLIRRHLYKYGPTGIHDLARAVAASLATIRRDLQRLEEQGIILRTHGGAEIAASVGAKIGFEAREHRNLAAKRAIADLAYDHIRPQTAIFPDCGTTVLQLARRLKLDPMPLTGFTNSLAVVNTLPAVEPVEVLVLAGRVRQSNHGITGPLAEQSIAGLWFDQLFLGASAMQDDETIATADLDEAQFNTAMLQRASEKFLIADSSKFSVHATFGVTRLDQSITVLTDTNLDDARLARLRERNVPVMRAPV